MCDTIFANLTIGDHDELNFDRIELRPGAESDTLVLMRRYHPEQASLEEYIPPSGQFRWTTQRGGNEQNFYGIYTNRSIIPFPVGKPLTIVGHDGGVRASRAVQTETLILRGVRTQADGFPEPLPPAEPKPIPYPDPEPPKPGPGPKPPPRPKPEVVKFYQGIEHIPVDAYELNISFDNRMTLALVLQKSAKLAKRGELHLVIDSNTTEQRWVARYDSLTLSPLPVGVRASITTPGDMPPLGLKPEAILRGVTFERLG